jgi:hypothetical protein
MNRFSAACFVGVLGALAAGCGVTGVGDPCTPESEFSPSFGQSVPEDLTIDVNSVQCETRVCLVHYFRGRVSCPFGNDGQAPSGDELSKKCQAVPNKRGLYTLDGVPEGKKCCPVVGDVDEKPLPFAVNAQCAERPANDAVYCSCRCAVPDDPEIDKSKVNLCTCPSGYECKELCGPQNCSTLPKGKWGSYCVKAGAKGAGFDPNSPSAATYCTAGLTPPS